MICLPERFFVTGTDTGVGKTLVCSLLMSTGRFLYWKPIQSGLEEMTDTQWVQKATGLPDAFFLPERYLLSEPLSPHHAAMLDGVQIRLADFAWPDKAGHASVIVEGAGGIMVPINKTNLMTDLIKYLELPVLLVARSTLGTINHTLLSLAQLRREDIPVLGVVMNGPVNNSNRVAIETFGKVKVLAELPPIPIVGCQTIQKLVGQVFQNIQF